MTYIYTIFPGRVVFLMFLIGVYVLSFCSVFAQNNEDPVLRLDVELDGLYTAVKNSGDEVYMVEEVEEGRDVFHHMLDHELLQIYDDAQILDLLYIHLTTATPYCREGKLYDYDDNIYQYFDDIRKGRFDVQISPDYISTVFGETETGYSIKSLFSALRIYDGDELIEKDDSFSEACQWIVACEYGITPLTPEQKEANLPLTSFSNKTKDVCISYIQELYQYYNQLQTTASNLHIYQGLDNYYNHETGNDGDDLTFDVRQGFESIGNLLSSYMGDVDTLEFYPSNFDEDKEIDPLDPEQALVNTQGQDPFQPYNDQSDDTIVDMENQERIDTYNPSPGIPTIKTPTQKTAEYSSDAGSVGGGLASVGPRDGSGIGGVPSLTNSRTLSIPKTGPLSSLVKESVTVSDPNLGVAIIQPDLCTEEIFLPEEIPANVVEEAIKLRENKKEYAAALDTNQRIAEVLRHPGNFDKEEKEQKTFYDLPAIQQAEIVDELVNFSNANIRIDPGNGDQDPDEMLQEVEDGMRACIQEHTEEDPDSFLQKAKKSLLTTPPLLECIQKLLCKEFTDPSGLGLATMRICTIPAQSVKQNNVQQVSSLHEVLDSLLNISITMQNSGSLMRHVKTKEFLAFKTLKLDLSKMFSFSVNSSSKPPKTTKNPKVEAATIEETQKDLVETVLKKPNNKYDQTGLDRTMYFYSPMLDRVLIKTALTDQDRKNNIQETERFLESLEVDPQIVSTDYDQQLFAEKQLYTAEYFNLTNTYFLPSLADEVEEFRNTLNKKYDELK